QPDPTLNGYCRKATTTAQRISAMIRFTEEYEEIGVKAPTWQDCRTLVDTAAKQALPGKVMVKNDLPAGAEVFADPLVVKVFYNLMDNAARYGGKITTIRFSVRESGDDYLIVCEDDGEGIPDEEKERIFERRSRYSNGVLERTQGLVCSSPVRFLLSLISLSGKPGSRAKEPGLRLRCRRVRTGSPVCSKPPAIITGYL
ncbi:MAG: sensor histidine kinase, partial [Methanoregula sp.]|nr:sensor histidine kinase [Methanoregula sp.]